MIPLRPTLAAAAILAASSPASAAVFERIATFHVADNLPTDADPTGETVAEIIAATEDGMTLVYTDAPGQRIGMVDLQEPTTPKPAGIVALDGQPTSVVIAGEKALVGVVTSESRASPSGHLAVVDLPSRSIATTCHLAGQPDSLARSSDGRTLAVVIENERDEDVNNGAIPQVPSGNLVTFRVGNDGSVDCATMRVIALGGLADVAPDDPEPEYVDINRSNEAVVSLQENNHFAIVDLATATVIADFSAGTVDLTGVDATEDGVIRPTDSLRAVAREPDAVAWIDENRFVSANEGDWLGGSRGFTIFHKDGSVAYDSGTAFEDLAIRLGHYPEQRSGARGTEPEGAEVGVFGEDTLLFIGAERASLVGVYRDHGPGNPPAFVQALPGGIGPEGLLALPDRGLFVTASETDLRPDGGIGSVVTIYRLGDGTPSYPTIAAAPEAGGWAAISGAIADPAQPGRAYAVTDSALAEARILTLDTTHDPVAITAATTVTGDGAAARELDLEGIALSSDGGFWLVSEGNPERDDDPTPNRLLRVDAEGAILEDVRLPERLAASAVRYGFEGVATTGAGDGEIVWIAVQREWQDDPAGMVKLLAYRPADGSWSMLRYPLDRAGRGWIGLSEIAAVPGGLVVVERDDQIGRNAAVKKLTFVPLDGVVPVPIGADAVPVVDKTEIRDLLPDLAQANGYVLDKVESLIVDSTGEAAIITDNDGVDGHSGETLFIRLGTLDLPM